MSERETVHELKTWPYYFQAILNGEKPWELRVNDRDYKVSDTLHLREYDPLTMEYTGRECWQHVAFILYGGAFGLPANLCIMSLWPLGGDPIPADIDKIAANLREMRLMEDLHTYRVALAAALDVTPDYPDLQNPQHAGEFVRMKLDQLREKIMEHRHTIELWEKWAKERVNSPTPPETHP